MILFWVCLLFYLILPEGVTSKLKGILDKGLSLSASKKICACDRDFFGGR